MKNYLCLFIMMTLSIISFSQDAVPNPEVASLKAEMKLLNDKLTDMTRVQWTIKRNQIISALEISNKTEAVFRVYNTNELNKSSIFAALLKANNPNSPIFGNKSYNQIILDIAKKNFVDGIEDPDGKTRFQEILTKIGSSPLLTTIIGSNPVASLASSIVGAASQFFTTTKAGEKITGVKNAIKQEKLTAFENEIKPFIEYYSKLYNANENFSKNLDLIEEDRKKLNESIPGVRNRLINTLSLDINSADPLSIQIMSKYSDLNADYSKYSEYLSKQEIAKAVAVANEILEYEVKLNLYETNYKKIIKTLADESKLAIESGISIASKNGLETKNLQDILNKLVISNDKDVISIIYSNK